MAARKDYYAILGVDKGADAGKIKRAYRTLARKHHPDVNPGDTASEERFKEISEAYHVLSDPERRRKYDQMGPDGFAQEFDMSDFGRNFQDLFRGGHGEQGGFRDLGFFEELLSGAGLGGFRVRTGGPTPGSAGRRRRTQGRDVRVQLRLSLDEALHGAERTVSFRDASGRTRTARARIPAGTGPGATVRLKGKGEPGAGGGPPGDLYLKVEVAPHPTFEIDGANLRVTVPVTVYEAALGGSIEVPTPGGSTRIRLPEATRSGQVFRIRGAGLPRSRGGPGDLLARVEIVLPQRIDEPLAELMRRFRDQHPYDPREQTRDETGVETPSETGAEAGKDR